MRLNWSFNVKACIKDEKMRWRW